MIKIISYSLILILFGCTKPKENDIKENFYNIFPNTNILSIETVEGDSDNVYHEITYVNNNSTKALKEVFLYQDINGSWGLTKHFAH